jgi:hypothetical protein
VPPSNGAPHKSTSTGGKPWSCTGRRRKLGMPEKRGCDSESEGPGGG